MFRGDTFVADGLQELLGRQLGAGREFDDARLDVGGRGHDAHPAGLGHLKTLVHQGLQRFGPDIAGCADHLHEEGALIKLIGADDGVIHPCHGRKGRLGVGHHRQGSKHCNAQQGLEAFGHRGWCPVCSNGGVHRGCAFGLFGLPHQRRQLRVWLRPDRCAPNPFSATVKPNSVAGSSVADAV